jgi:Undecaprenyl-phosphate glucose phosphotransferase
MLRRYQHLFAHVFRGLDACVVLVAWLVSYWARFSIAPLVAVTKGLPKFSTYSSLAPLVAMLWLGVFALTRVYESRRMRGRIHELQLLLKAHGTALLLFVAMTYLFEDYRYSRLVMLYFGVLGGVALVAYRLVLRAVLRALRVRGLNQRNVLAVGEGPTLERLIERLDAFGELGLRVIGVVTQEGSTVRSVSSKAILGHFGDVSEIIRDSDVDELLVSLPPSQTHELPRLMHALKDETLDIRIVPDMQQYVMLSSQIEEFEGLPILLVNDSPLFGGGAIAKRLTDVVVSVAALIVLSPLLLLIALVIKLTSDGPVVYLQERMGIDRRRFSMIKFRTMKVGAESGTGAVWAQAVDNRRTAFGTLLRKTSLDELPQLWNVLCGDMSLVGPRPERPVFVSKFREEVPSYMFRHKVHAGITGWAQVNGWRGNTSLERRIECDLFYIRNWSYQLDLKIMVLTLWKGLINKNAY